MLKRIFHFAAFFIILSFGVNVLAQTPPVQVDPLKNPYLFYNRSLDDRNDYLTPLLEFESHEKEYLSSDATKYIVPDLMAYRNAYVGRYQRALAIQESEWGKDEMQPAITSSKIDDYRPEPGAPAIARLAASRQVVMINEEHVTPQHRAFTRDLLPLMWKAGFRYFAAETFNDNVTQMTSTSYPNQKTGFYTDDPVFGDMVRTALRLGFKLIPYEFHGAVGCKNPDGKPNFCQNDRERGQAQNLYDRTLKIDPKAKVFVHVGRGHNQKLKLDDWAMMASHFRDISGVDPLSIDQMQSERADRRFESPIYRYVDAKWKLTSPAVFRNKAGEFWQGYGQDVVVFHPRSRYRNGRPIWLMTGGRHEAPVKGLTLDGAHAPFLVQAFVEGEGEDAIPIDQVIPDASNVEPVLVVPKGQYRLRVLDSSGGVVLTKRLKL